MCANYAASSKGIQRMTLSNNLRSFLLLVLLGCGTTWAATPVSSADTGARHFQWLDQYCSKCHNANDWAGGLAIDTLSPQNIGSDAKVWEETVVKLRGRLMPPIGEQQPAQADINQFVGWMEGRLDAHAAANPDPGRVGLHRRTGRPVPFEPDGHVPEDIQGLASDGVGNGH
jgi:mono/diheme cytochrome c family protein